MASKAIELQAKNYLSDLNNTAFEYGFNPVEHWEFSLANEKEKSAIEQKYYPAVFTEIQAEHLFDFYSLMLVKYGNSKSDIGWKMDNQNLNKTRLFICAFNPERMQ